MKKISALFAFFIASVVAIAAPPTQTKVYPFNYGKMEDTVYTNPFFGFTISVPSGWNVQNKTQIDYAMEKGKEIVDFDDKTYEKALKNVDISSMTLMMLSKYETGAPVPYNPTLMIMAENVTTSPGIKTGADYLYHVNAGFEKSNMGYVCSATGDTLHIGNFTFDPLNCNKEESVAHLGYYGTIIKRYAFSFIYAYSNDDEKNELLSIIRTAAFKK